jgi:glycosyltransferase involved in cell wall biosynthesis
MLYSVVIPTFNRCRMLAEALDSVLDQAYPSIEIVVVDDGSTDDTGDMLQRNYPQVRVLQQANQGPAAARNRGIAASNGDVIAFLDSDDVWLEHKVMLELALLEQFPDAAMLAGNATSFVGGNLRAADVFAQRRIAFAGRAPRYFDWSFDIMKLGPTCCTSGMVYRRAALLSMGEKPFDESLRLDEDWDLEFRFFSRHKGLLYPQIVCHQRVMDDGTRHHYSPTGKTKSPAEQDFIWRQQRDILSRYLDGAQWDAATRQGYLQRHEELTALLSN